ncbi:MULTISPECIES: pyridoxal phosphate-dependent aminotransferase [unclassified Clostridium]|uniref:pyridoxal phosphate-dependent aminotransferase n=1 Tax=unclassified Clostridium TaxID=2614128 RepID=UPI001C8CB83A|nr:MULTISPECIES: aminotransferase class I/II-fold pyridoxal phosphate-dependent enzyme [unclassified Clostridium]MBX9136769.1 aminotransferase class I/II-fold pyridoxal phosphate-dependent enzyme [Clostridium sp. K12(2020)]MBX9143579.1 aminotransferase class I/II-fold pyridoxal phosphate-dependent enzyme [Clostridium sp. K13]MDU2288923.1 aminotransferase class I/II-fold pyridoxal phosphate-dependent enzyme [Clostridium celatum]
MNENLDRVKISGIRKFYNEVQKVEGAISLTLGQPDFKLPTSIEEGLVNAIQENKTTYTSNSGIVELREEISKYLLTKDIAYEADELCITVGGSEALFNIFTALLNKDDKVLIPTPAYPAYESIVTILGGTVVNYSLDNEFKIDVKDIKNKIKDMNIKYLVLSLPSNPTGAILSKEEKDELIELIKENDILVITDEIYESLCYDEYYSIAQCKEIKEKIIYVGGFSKMFSMTGLRIGYYACSQMLMNEIIKIHQYNVSCAPSICQWAVYNGLKYGLKDVSHMKEVFRSRKDMVVGKLKEMGLDVITPKGAFYVFPSIKKFNIPSEEFALRLLNEEKVACVPGTAFGIGGEGYLRISYCYSDDELIEALKRIEKFINKI